MDCNAAAIGCCHPAGGHAGHSTGSSHIVDEATRRHLDRDGAFVVERWWIGTVIGSHRLVQMPIAGGSRRMERRLLQTPKMVLLASLPLDWMCV